MYSVTSFSELRREALLVERENLLHPGKDQKTPWVAQLFGGNARAGDRGHRQHAHRVRTRSASGCRGRYVTLGTDGFGRSDGRAALRDHFEVDRRFVVLATLKALADDGVIERTVLVQAVKKLGVDPDKANPLNS